MPSWLWPVLIAVVLIFLAMRSYYTRFRRACRTVREELAEWVPQNYPGYSVSGEQQGNLLVRTPDGGELLWEMTDLYADVVRLPGMGGDAISRERLYRAAAEPVLAPKWQPGQRLDPQAHAARLRPQLFIASGPTGETAPLMRDVPGLPVHVRYMLDLPEHPRPLTESELAGLGLDPEGIHRLAMENLARDFPEEMVRTALGGSGSAIQFGDGFDAARMLLLPPLLSEGERLVALAPHRDMLLLLPGDGSIELDKMREGLRELAHEGHERLLEQPVEVTRGGFAVL